MIKIGNDMDSTFAITLWADVQKICAVRHYAEADDRGWFEISFIGDGRIELPYATAERRNEIALKLGLDLDAPPAPVGGA